MKTFVSASRLVAWDAADGFYVGDGGNASQHGELRTQFYVDIRCS